MARVFALSGRDRGLRTRTGLKAAVRTLDLLPDAGSLAGVEDQAGRLGE